ncbi:MAG: CRISPR-associated protein Cas4 [Gammaproteobacteria bacterium]|nr:CRISPR-associated protein Cas4 [Gammaproteobacteria bacterium]
MVEDEPISLSALQHMLYCPRQCALIHNEQQWAENEFTAEGRILHERVDTGIRERRGEVTTARNVPLRSRRLGLVGFADLVEMHSGKRPYPVEYKRGKPKVHRADEVQLCAQAICLEEMLDTCVPEGALFYGQNRRRKVVVFDEALRTLTEDVTTAARSLIRSGATPPATYENRKCSNCSLMQICQPRQSSGAGTVAKWLKRKLED